jgi:long-subunit fatty acid transport protein
MTALSFVQSYTFTRVLAFARTCAVACTLVLVPLIPGGASGQSLPEIPIIYDVGIGARAMGMGQAHVAVCEDASATFYNPACLAHVRRIELSTGFSHLNENLDVTFFDETTTSTLGSTRLSSLGVAYPFPTYRGSLVIGFAYNRTHDTDSDYMRYGFNPTYYHPYLGVVEGIEKEGILERGGISSWTVAMGTDVSPEVSVGASVSFLSGTSKRTYDYVAEWDAGLGTIVDDYYYQVDDADVTGWTAALGTVARIGNVGRIGLTVRFPEYVTFDGSQYTEVYYGAPDTYIIEEILFEDEITLPLSFVLGASVAPVPGLILAADVKYADWKQIDYAGPIKIDNEYAYRATTSVRLGAEYTLPFAPARVRGGYLTEPVAYRLLPDFTGTGQIQSASIDSDGKFYTLGAGLLLAESFTLDVAWVHGGFERSIPDYSEKNTTDKVFVTAGFRF